MKEERRKQMEALIARRQSITMEELCAKVEAYATILPPLEKTPNPSVLPSS